MTHSMLIASLLFMLSCNRSTTTEVQDAWNYRNDPNTFSSQLIRKYESLPKEGKLVKVPWTDTYWPFAEGGIAARWNGKKEAPWKYSFNDISALKKLSPEAIKFLSPAEKYDILEGKHTGVGSYPLAKYEKGRTHAEIEVWKGYCHAWAYSSLMFEEPNPVTMTNSQGITIPFGSSDVKALMAFAIGNLKNKKISGATGSRCEKETELGQGSQTECQDINAGSFHIILSNMIGIRKIGFIMDADRKAQVWNHPIYEFKTTEISRQNIDSSSKVKTEITLNSVVSFATERDPEWSPAIALGKNMTRTENYRYRIELDAKGEIIGGSWISAEYPDFVWNLKSDKIKFADIPAPQGISFAKIDELYRKSIEN